MASENAQPEPIRITFAKGTDVGQSRDHNEDYLDAFRPPDPAERRQKGDLFIVADGMGGHQAGDVASESAVRVVSHEYYADPDLNVRGSLVRAIKKANAYIRQQAQQAATRVGMGTTIVSAVVRGQELYLANVGDSRAYLMRQGKISQVTNDHSFVAEQVRAGILTLEEARSHPQRNVITRALGSKPEVKVDTYRGELQPGDTLLLCTDGLSEYVHEEDMLLVLGQYSPEEAISRLIAMANERGGTDNISTIVIRATPPAGAAASQPTVPSMRAAAAPARKRRSWAWIVGIAVIAMIAVVVLAAGVLFVAPRILGGRDTPTPSPTVAPSPRPSPTATVPPTSTPKPTKIEPTATLQFELSQLVPPDGAIHPVGFVTFTWRLRDAPTRPATFAVKSDVGELCNVDQQESCQVDLGEGNYRWWVEVLVDGEKVYETDPRVLHIRVSSTPTDTAAPTATFTPTPS